MRTDRFTPPAAWLMRLCVCAVLAAAAGGCGGSLGSAPGDGTPVDGNRDETAASALGKTFGEPNDEFSVPVVAVFNVDNVAGLQGTISSRGDLDIYLLGPLAAGAEVIVDAATSGSALDVSTALFDDDERLVFTNDDREGASARFLDSYMRVTTRHASGAYYLVVTHSAFAESGTFTGSYTIDVRISSGGSAPRPVGQTLLLDFDGAAIDSDVLGRFTIAEFNAGDIHTIYRGRTDEMKRTIRQVMEQNYERFQVAILTTDDPPPPSGAIVSKVFFGGFNRTAYGISEAVDLYNVDFCDDAIIYTESFTLEQFSVVPTAEQMGLAIGNVASHEAGHLLGLNHVTDDLDLMDDRSPADAFLHDQEFRESPLSSDIMSIGTQDGVLLLDETVGKR